MKADAEAALIAASAQSDARRKEMGLGAMYFDRQGQPIGLYDWVRLFEDPKYKRIALTQLPDGRVVSTVWMGLDHGFYTREIFESMCFGVPETVEIFGEMREMPLEQDCERYATEYDAFWGHRAMVERHTLRLNP